VVGGEEEEEEEEDSDGIGPSLYITLYL